MSVLPKPDNQLMSGDVPPVSQKTRVWRRRRHYNGGTRKVHTWTCPTSSFVSACPSQLPTTSVWFGISTQPPKGHKALYKSLPSIEHAAYCGTRPVSQTANNSHRHLHRFKVYFEARSCSLCPKVDWRCWDSTQCQHRVRLPLWALFSSAPAKSTSSSMWSNQMW